MSITHTAVRYQSLEETTAEDVEMNQDKASANSSSLPQNDIHLIPTQQLDIGKYKNSYDVCTLR